MLGAMLPILDSSRIFSAIIEIHIDFADISRRIAMFTP